MFVGRRANDGRAMNATEWEGGAVGALNGSLECPAEWGVPAGERLARLVLHGVLLNALGAAGLCGNALAALVLSRPQMRSSVTCLLVGLAAADSMVIVTSVLLFGLSALYPATGRLRHYYYRVCPLLTPIAFPLALVAQTASVYLTLMVTLERWVAVCHPLRAKALCTSARARWHVLATLLFSLAYNAPRFLEVDVYRLDAPDGDYVYCLRASELRLRATYVAVYIHWLYLVVMYFVPFGALAVLNARIARQVRRAQLERARLSRVQRRELSLARMLLVVVLVFFLCNLLPLLTNAAEVFMGDEFERLDVLVKTSNLLVTLNSSVNFLIYVTFGEKFKRVFLKMFFPRRLAAAARDSPDHTRDDSLNECERVSLRLARDSTLRRSRATGRGGRVYYPPAGTELSSAALALPPPAAARWNGHGQAAF